MLEVSSTRRLEWRTAPAVEVSSAAEFYAECVGFLRRQGFIIAVAVLLSLVLGALYTFTAPPRYSGRATLIVDAPRTQFFQSQSPPGEAAGVIDSATVDTQIQILKSDDLALEVIRTLHLSDDAEFISPASDIIGTIVGAAKRIFTGAVRAIAPAVTKSSDQTSREERALRTFQDRLKIERVGLTYAITINFEFSSPYRAAQIANAIADAYELAAFQAKYQITGRSAAWLQDRLKELREQASAADRAVVDYKADNNIVDAGGQLVNEQQLAELNSQLVQARASSAEAKARVDRVQQIIAGGDVDPEASATATVTDTLHNDVINKMRGQYLDDERRATEFAAKYGARHMAVISLQNEMRDLRRSIFEELKRTAESYQSDFAIAEARQDSLQKSLNHSIAESNVTDRAQITLHDLQSSAQTSRDIYDNFLQRYMQSVQQQSSPVSEARLISHARVPVGKSGPGPVLVVLLSGLGGLIFGTAFGALREISDRVFRTAAQVSKCLQADCIAVIPRVQEAARSSPSFERLLVAVEKRLREELAKLQVEINRKSRTRAVPQSRHGEGLKRLVVDPLARLTNVFVGRVSQAIGRQQSQPILNQRRRKRRRHTLSHDKSVCWTVTNSPFSRFSESIRAVKVAADSGDKARKTIGITSALPAEGKSTVALSLAALITQGGARAILVDCDLRNPTLSDMLTPRASAGLLEVIAGNAALDDVLWREPISGLTFLPAVPTTRVAYSSDILASQQTRTLLERLRESYDYVIIDLSPLAPVVDARVMTPLVDSFVFVVEWGRTKIEVAQLALNSVRRDCDNLIGVALNKADMKAFSRYANLYEDYYNAPYY